MHRQIVDELMSTFAVDSTLSIITIITSTDALNSYHIGPSLFDSATYLSSIVNSPNGLSYISFVVSSENLRVHQDNFHVEKAIQRRETLRIF